MNINQAATDQDVGQKSMDKVKNSTVNNAAAEVLLKKTMS